MGPLASETPRAILSNGLEGGARWMMGVGERETRLDSV